jgi:ABC-type branched-subunit amino acid transport system substrate-binding protein
MIDQTNNSTKPVPKTEELNSKAAAISQGYKQAVQESNQAGGCPGPSCK